MDTDFTIVDGRIDFGCRFHVTSLHHEEFSGACRNSFVPDKIHIK